MIITNNIILSSHYPIDSDLSYEVTGRINSLSTVSFDVTNIEENIGNNLDVFKVYIDYGDFTQERINVKYDANERYFKLPEKFYHTYTANVSTLSSLVEPRIVFYYRNGKQIKFFIDLYYTENNLIDMEPVLINSSLFTDQLSSNSIFNIVDNNGLFFNKIAPNKEFDVYEPVESIFNFDAVVREDGNFIGTEDNVIIEID